MTDQLSVNANYRPILFAITIAVFMCLLDSHIVRICLPVISGDFKISSAQAAWINLAYLLVVTPGLPVFGKISDIIGARKIFITGYFIFITGSIFCAISPSYYFLVISRFIQGLGGAMIISSGPSMIPEYIPADKRGFAFGLQAMAAGLGISLGAPLGGILTEMLSWRYIFYINVPVAALGIIMAIKYIPPEIHIERMKNFFKKFDTAAGLYLYSCLVFITVALSLISKLKTGFAQIFLFTALSLIFMVLFLRLEKKCTEPLIDSSLFSKPFILLIFSTFIGYILMSGNSFMMPFYLMSSLGLTPSQSGFMIMVFSLSFSFFSAVAGKIADKTDPKILGSFGMLMTAVSFAFFVFVIGNRSVYQTAIFLFLYGSAFAFFVSPSNKLLISYVPKNKQGVSNGIYRTSVFLASLIGLAIYGSLSDHVTPSAMAPLFFNIYMYSIFLPVISFIVLYFSRLPSLPAVEAAGSQRS